MPKRYYQKLVCINTIEFKIMNINKYIKWDEIWTEEVDVQNAIGYLNYEDENEYKIIKILEDFLKDKDVELNFDECYFEYDSDEDNDGRLFFFFSETGGQNESDTQGWSREYSFIVDSNFLIIGASYLQG